MTDNPDSLDSRQETDKVQSPAGDDSSEDGSSSGASRSYKGKEFLLVWSLLLKTSFSNSYY